MLLSATSLVAERDEIELFAPLTFSLNKGDVIHLVGPNGSGKSTLLRGLLGLNQSLEGDVQWHCDSIAYVGHKSGLNLSLTVLESLRLLLLLDGMRTDDERAIWALEQVGLAPWRYQLTGKLSAGQTRKVALSRLFLDDAPTVWLLDEPYTALDMQSVSILSDRINRHADSQGAVMLTSHQALQAIDHRVLELAV